jgi:hypothetical protein
MNSKLTVALAIAAGFVGGIASQRFMPPTVYAQAPTVAKEIRAQSFVIVDEKGVPRGAFGIDKKHRPTIEITDSKGHASWSEFQGGFVLCGRCKPSLVPPQ